MELLSILLCLSVIFGYITGNIAVIIIVTSRITVQSNIAGYTLKIIAALLSLILVNLPSLLYAAYGPTTLDIFAGLNKAELKTVTVLWFCWISTVVLTGWIGFLRDWYLKCKVMRKQGPDIKSKGHSPLTDRPELEHKSQPPLSP
jgi:hypothetical protein